MRISNLLIGLLVVIGLVSCDTEKIKRDQYYAEGAMLYATHCENCHQRDGKGMASLYPSLHYIKDDYKRLFCTIKNGLNETIVVNGDTFNRPMPANPKLTALEIAEIATYVTNTWGGQTDYIRIDSVKAALADCR